MNLSMNQNVKRGGMLAALLCSSLVVASCATGPTAPIGAENVRGKLTTLQENPNLADRARMELRDAEIAVRLAEQPLPDADAALGQHRVFMADRAVAIAEAKATTRYAEDQRKRYGEERAAARLNARTLEVSKAREDAAGAAALAMQQEAEYQSQIAALQAEVTDRGVVLTLGDVLFATGSAKLQGGASSNLNRLVDFLNQYPDRNAQIEGHTDNVGSADYNQRLSQDRADAVRHYLTQQGIASQRLSTSGLGMDRPVANNDTPTGRQQNRRVEIIIENPS
ncbi:OmpA family protein [Marinobacter sp. chi1]|uniref:OmpA family protein n=1 Tax=Marinobacter suaedae TaxID=3057675 RepID=A0ABT8VXR8_9GAMM|nr:OmpA family protein [Marinobacter sp. chi1]MDO3720746.1 OmpA family protein [Marinobacter sp. chi1]